MRVTLEHWDRAFEGPRERPPMPLSIQFRKMQKNLLLLYCLPVVETMELSEFADMCLGNNILLWKKNKKQL